MGSLAEVVEDCFGVLQLYSDGSVNRVNECDIDFGDHNKKGIHDIVEEGWLVEWEDFIFDEQHQLYLRVYKPSNKNISINNNKKLPILYYIHGGGFCLGSRTWPNCHNTCLRLSYQLQAIVIAPDYRLAPEHKLPAAIEDGLNALNWLQLQAKRIKEIRLGEHYYNDQNTCNKLLEDGVDFENVFIMGDSSGGNVAHHMAVRLGSGSPKLAPVRICGYVLLAPFFGGSLRTKSEADGPPEPILTLESLDRFWRLCLPRGEGRDHPVANPFGLSSPKLDMVSLDPILVIVGGKEIMKDRVEDYARRLKEHGKDITYAKFEGQHHGFFTHNPCSHVSNQLLQLVKRFMFAKKPFC